MHVARSIKPRRGAQNEVESRAGFAWPPNTDPAVVAVVHLAR